ncbi:hypothetical protein FOCC_FOCC015599 [Frankliniella occidentalis]|nr:hypothetical protein FOCC_FOCC015599 [Frankliniella occidentalis]
MYQASSHQRPKRKVVQRLKPQTLTLENDSSDTDLDIDFEDPTWESKNNLHSSDDDSDSGDDVCQSTSKTPVRSVHSPAHSVNSPARSIRTPSCFNTPHQPTNARAQPFDSPAQSLPRTPRRRETTKTAKRKERTLLRNSGHEYKTSKDKVVSARSLQPLADCRMKCREKLNEEDRKVVFQEYWGQRDFDRRVNYISSHVFQKPTAVKRTKDEKSGRNRTCTLRYELDINNSRIVVCKKCFLATLCENDSFVQRALLNKKRSLSGVTSSDRRGRHPSVRKTPRETIEAVKKHINEFPRYSSHYGRSHSSKMYLGVGMTIQRLYEDYSDKDRNNPKVSLSTYSREFKKTGLKFKPPQIDTCQKCDTYEVTIKTATEEEQPALIAERDAHHKKAEIAYDRKKEDRLNQTDKSWLLSFDLQQVLYCPQLTSGKVFYKRQLSVYNLTILDCFNKRGVNHMWDETEGGRGANEIASCLYNFIISDVPAGVEKLTLWSDTCSGQNKNSIVCGALITCITEHETLNVIDHKFLVPGHTHMECDQVHAAIEKKKRGAEGLHHPSDFFNLVKTVEYRKKTLDVVEMKDQFLDFAALLKLKCQGPLVMRAKNQDGEVFNYGPVQWFRYQKHQPAIILYKDSHDENAPFKEISFRRRGKLGLNSLKPSKCSSVPRPISLEKKDDLMALLHLVNPAHHDFYINLPSSADALDIDPDCVPSDDVSDEIHNDLEES